MDRLGDLNLINASAVCSRGHVPFCQDIVYRFYCGYVSRNATGTKSREIATIFPHRSVYVSREKTSPEKLQREDEIKVFERETGRRINPKEIKQVKCLTRCQIPPNYSLIILRVL